MRTYRTVDSVGREIDRFESLLRAAEAWNGAPSGVDVEELYFGEWERVPTDELQRKLRVARLHRAVTQ